MIVKKVVTMADKLNVPMAGVVQNMAYVECPDCNSKIRIFSKKSSEEQAKYLGIPLISEMPIDMDLVEAMEQGEAEKYICGTSKYKNIISKIV